MTKILTEDSIRHAYDRKKQSCEDRNLEFSLPYNYYKMLMRSRAAMVCFYTGKQFDMRSTDNDNYPSLERLSESEGYTVTNTVLCCKIANSVKNEFIESGKGLSKSMGDKQVRIYRSIEKVLSQPDLISSRMKPYQELYEKSVEREQEQEAKETRKQELSEACQKAKRINEAKVKAEEQLTLSKHYAAIYAAFEQGGLVYDVSIRSHRDIFRKKYCALTGSKFETIMDKFFWIPDQGNVKGRGIVSKGDFIVTTVDSAVAVDNLKNLGTLKNISLNILKHV